MLYTFIVAFAAVFGKKQFEIHLNKNYFNILNGF